MPAQDLAGKIFSFDYKLGQNDLTRMIDPTKNIESIIRNLPCMRGIDEEFMPKFKFFKINKSKIKTLKNEEEKTMLCFIDIS